MEAANLRGSDHGDYALERFMHFGGLVTVPNLHNAFIYLRAKRDRMEKQMRMIASDAKERSFES